MIFWALLMQATAQMPTTPTTPPPVVTSAPEAQPARRSVQQMFDSANADVEADRCAEAIAAYTALEPRLSEQRHAFVIATVRARKGRCLEATGQLALAEASLTWALAHLDPANDVSRVDVYYARMAMGRIRYRQNNFAAARSEFAAALPLANTDARQAPLIWLARAGTFEEQAAALVYADEALALAEQVGREGRQSTAIARTVRARIYLNQGENATASRELLRAVTEQGGLDRSVGASDIITRSDLALASILLNDPTQAQRYLAFTGTGQLGSAPFGGGGTIAPPPCGAETGLQPDDMAIVEFGIGADGAVTYATPIYLSRPSDARAAAFAETVRGWSWRAEDVSKISPLLRAITRVELRCSTALQTLDATALLESELNRWLVSQTVAPYEPAGSPLEILTATRAELASRRAANGGTPMIQPLLAIANSPLTSEDETVAVLTEALDLAQAHHAPVAARTAIEMLLLGARQKSEGGYGDRMLRLLNQPEIAADAQSSAVIRLMAAEYSGASEAAALLNIVANDARLPATDPLKVAALVRLANVQAAAGNVDAARVSYAATGLEAQQCALVDARPSMQRSGASSSDYPMEAMRWGFEGWTRVEFDILPNGHTASQRAVIAYPPLVFRRASVGIIEDARFTQSYRPDGNLGCGGAAQTIRFLLPER